MLYWLGGVLFRWSRWCYRRAGRQTVPTMPICPHRSGIMLTGGFSKHVVTSNTITSSCSACAETGGG